ncbi:splicing factor 3B subunit 2 [Pelomyxa schiedti]|nr:splicing factor 3B subunit 2 [Pelomyxa schiedti]
MTTTVATRSGDEDPVGLATTRGTAIMGGTIAPKSTTRTPKADDRRRRKKKVMKKNKRQSMKKLRATKQPQQQSTSISSTNANNGSTLSPEPPKLTTNDALVTKHETNSAATKSGTVTSSAPEKSSTTAQNVAREEVEFVAQPPEELNGANEETRTEFMRIFAKLAGGPIQSAGGTVQTTEESEKAKPKPVLKLLDESCPTEPKVTEYDTTNESKTVLDEIDDVTEQEKLPLTRLPKHKDIKKLPKKNAQEQRTFCLEYLRKLARRPEIVDIHDVDAKDPVFLTYLKSCRNSVPVPLHWCHGKRRKYLARLEKPPFTLPDFIARTGVQTARKALRAHNRSKQPKLHAHKKVSGFMDLDYQTLYDAFFKYQEKPHLTIHGEVFYEGKDKFQALKSLRPGKLSSTLRSALGIPSDTSFPYPPPWLSRQQRFGPPPSYPKIKIPGVNMPIPDGQSWGNQPGSWGIPPVDEFGRPLYGDIFGIQSSTIADSKEYYNFTRVRHWGEDFIEEEKREFIEELQSKIAQSTSSAEPAEPSVTPPSPPDSSTYESNAVETESFFQVVEEARQSSPLSTTQIIPQSHTYNIPKWDVAQLRKRERKESTIVALQPEDLAEVDLRIDESMLRKHPPSHNDTTHSPPEPPKKPRTAGYPSRQHTQSQSQLQSQPPQMQLQSQTTQAKPRAHKDTTGVNFKF